MSSKRVIVPVADMRRDPDHRSERVSQALYGYLVEVNSSIEAFDQVQSSDGYEGWIAKDHLNILDIVSVSESIVATRWALFGLENGGELVLPFGAKVASDGGADLFIERRTMSRMILAVGSVDEPATRLQFSPSQVALSLLSAPYLWGGASPYGYDCSGFVQAVFRRCGIELPRDSKEQRQCGEEIPLAESTQDDLVFFPGHVALCLGDLRIIHATRLRGMVVVESLDPNSADCRHDLVGKVVAVRRVAS